MRTHGTISCARECKCKCEACREAVHAYSKYRHEKTRPQHGKQKLIAHYCGECPKCRELDAWLDEWCERMPWPPPEPRSIPQSSWLLVERAMPFFSIQESRGRGAIVRRTL